MVCSRSLLVDLLEAGSISITRDRPFEEVWEPTATSVASSFSDKPSLQNVTPFAMTQSARPNILFAIADDASHLGSCGNSFLRTPACDRVAREGVLFRNAFTTNPKCAPSRACILTGRHTWQLQEACNHFGVFPATYPVYPDRLEQAGYHVGHTGKGWAPGDFQAGGFARNPAGPEYNARTLIPPAEHISNKDYAANFREFLGARPAGAPFCFWYGGYEPHRKYQAGVGQESGKQLSDAPIPAYLPDDDIVRSDLLDYAYEIEWFDRHLGLMLEALEEAGELDNTIVVVTSDNGMPFPRVKGQIYDDDYHLPLAVRWKDGCQGGRIIDDFISFIDFAPTFLTAAGVAPHAQISGRSFLEILRSDADGQVDPARDHVLVGKERHDVGREGDKGYPVRAIRTADFLYVRNFKPDRWPAGNPETGFTNIDSSPTKSLILKQRDRGDTKYYQLAMGKRPAEELYDMRVDTECMRNLADDPARATGKAELWARLKQALEEQGDPRIFGKGELFDTYEYVGKGAHSWKARVEGWGEPQSY